jgi:CRISPR/Cas system-associated endoribonuclease Cas2
METQKKKKIDASNQQTQVGVKHVVALALSGNVEERVQTSVDVGETSTTNVNKIEVELQKLIDMIEEQEIVVPNAMLEQNNVQPHVEIDRGDTLNFTSSNYLPHPSLQ